LSPRFWKGENMSREKPIRPRKKPVQKRAVETVEVIYEAASQVFSSRGYAGTTTDRIAKRAGISIGSLYQYFPNKQSIAAGLVERHAQEGRKRIEAVLNRGMENEIPIKDLLRQLIEVFVKSHEKDPNLFRVLMDEVPHSDKIGHDIRQLMEYYTGITESFIRGYSPVQVKNPTVAAHLVTMTIQALVHWYICYHYEELDREAFIEETTLLLQRYISPEGAV
jgi:AcrR family transcriptional regulator